jgi:hypothetical protein
MSVWPAGGEDTQAPHTEDEVCVVMAGGGRIRVAGEDRPVRAGSAVYVGAGVEHRFHSVEDGLQVLVFWAPPTGSRADAAAPGEAAARQLPLDAAPAATAVAESAEQQQEDDDDEQDGEHGCVPAFRLTPCAYPDAQVRRPMARRAVGALRALPRASGARAGPGGAHGARRREAGGRTRAVPADPDRRDLRIHELVRHRALSEGLPIARTV